MSSYEPVGLRFFDGASRREMILVEEGPYSGWLCFRRPDGQWVSLREATEDDLLRIKVATNVGGPPEQPTPTSTTPESPIEETR